MQGHRRKSPRNPSPSTPGVFLAILGWLPAVGLGGSSIVCVGSDGHVVVEVRGAGCCEDPPPGGSRHLGITNRVTSSSPASSGGARECPDCIDLSVDEAFAPLRAPPYARPSADRCLAVPLERPDPRGPATDARAPGSSDARPPSGSLAHRRTTVLLR